MTKQILLKTPRGNTAVIPVDQFNFVTSLNKVAQDPTNYSYKVNSSTTVATTVLTTTINISGGTDVTVIDATNINFDDDGGGGGGDNLNDIDRQRKEELLYQLIEASKRRDLGRKRSVRCLYNSEEDDDDVDVDEYERHGHNDYDDAMDIDDVVCRDGDDCCYECCEDDDGEDENSSKSEEEETVTTMIDGIDINSDKNKNDFVDEYGNNTFNKSRRRQLNSGIRSTKVVTIATTRNHNSNNTRRQQHLSLSSRRDVPSQQQYRQKRTAAISSSTSSTSLMVAFYHQGRKVSLDRIWEWINGLSSSASTSSSFQTITASDDDELVPGCGTTSLSSTIPQFPLYLTLSTSVRLLGGIDRQNRVGSKFGGGGVSSTQNAERDRKERLKQLALESIDLAKDPYLMRNHIGTYECKLCLTLHTNEANYLAHTQGKKHQHALGKRAHMEKIRKAREEEQQNNLKRPPPGPLVGQQQSARKSIKIGRPAYQVFKSRDVDTNQRCLTFELTYKDINEDLSPRHRFMSAYEQTVDVPPDRRYQYVLFAAEPYETIAFKIPNEPLDRDHGRLITHWDNDDKKFTLTLYFSDVNVNATDDGKIKNRKDDDEMETDGLTKTCTTTTTSTFAPALGST